MKWLALLLVLLIIPVGSAAILEGYNEDDGTEIGLQLTQWSGSGFRVGLESNVDVDVNNIMVKLYRQGTGHTLYANITEANSSGVSTGTVVSTGETSSTDGITTSASGEYFNLSMSAATLQLGHNYTLILYTDGSGGGDRLVYLADSTPSYDYVNHITLDDGASWSPQTHAGNFEIQGTRDGDVIVDLVAPTTGSSTLNKTNQFSATIDPTNNTLQNATYYIYDNENTLISTTTISLSGTTPVTIYQNLSVDLGLNTWNVLACASGNCFFSGTNNTITHEPIFNSANFTANVSEGSSQNFVFNVTLPAGLSASDGTLRYNNTNYVATKQTIGSDTIYTATLTTPDLTANQDFEYTFNVSLTDSSSTEVFFLDSNNQTVNALGIDDCGVHTLVILNTSLKDEDTLADIDGSVNNASIHIDLTLTSADGGSETTFSQNYSSVNSAAVCLSTGALTGSSYFMDAQIRYTADTYATEFYNIQNFSLTSSTAPNEIDLYDLLTSRVQEFLVTFKNSNFLAEEGAIIEVTRKYISEGIFRTVEAPRTDELGQAIVHLVLSDEIYTFNVYKNGQLLATFDNKKAVCENQATGDCKINLNAFSTTTDIDDFVTKDDVTYTFNFNEDTRVVTVTYSSISGGSKTTSLNVTKFDGYGNETLCGQSVVSSAGTLSCTIPASYQNVTGLAEFYVDGALVDSRFVKIFPDADEIFGGTRIVMMIVLYLVLGMMMLTSTVAAIIGAMMGMIIGAMLLLIEGGSLIGSGSIILWFVVAGGIILYKISNR